MLDLQGFLQDNEKELIDYVEMKPNETTVGEDIMSKLMDKISSEFPLGNK